MSVLQILYVIAMAFWLLFAIYDGYAERNTRVFGRYFITWVLLLIVGARVFFGVK